MVADEGQKLASIVKSCFSSRKVSFTIYIYMCVLLVYGGIVCCEWINVILMLGLNDWRRMSFKYNTAGAQL